MSTAILEADLEAEAVQQLRSKLGVYMKDREAYMVIVLIATYCSSNRDFVDLVNELINPLSEDPSP